MPSAHLPVRAEGGFLVRAGGFFFRYRNVVFPIVLLALFTAFPPVFAGGSKTIDRWVNALGIAVAVAGQALRVLVIGHVYIQRGGRKGRVYAAALVTGGFFAHCRNPLYLGNVMILLGLFIVHNNPWVYALGIPFFLVAYSAIVATEEAYLRRTFGAEYDAYCARVPRWVPRLRGLRRSLDAHRFDWRRVIVKDYGSASVWIASLIVLLAWETVTHAHRNHELYDLTVLAVLLGVVIVGWAAARVFKKGTIFKKGSVLSPHG